MSEMRCPEVLGFVARGEAASSPGVERHLAHCPTCTREAVEIRLLLREIASPAAAQVPGALDAAVRAILLPAPSVRPSHRAVNPALALGVGSLAVAPIVFVIARVLGGAGADTWAWPLAAAMVCVYLAICMAATMPLLLFLAPTATTHARR